MEDTIRRNTSPVRCEGDLERPESSSSVNTDSDESMLPQRSALLHSFSTNDASIGEYKYTVTVGDDSIRITGTNLDLVRVCFKFKVLKKLFKIRLLNWCWTNIFLRI